MLTSFYAQKGTRLLVCDAGGSTTDVAAYEVTAISQSSLSLAELDVPTCKFNDSPN